MDSNELDKLLRYYGWTPDRRVKADEWRRALEDDGLTAIPEAIEVICSFGGIRIPADSARNGISGVSSIFFDPLLPGGSAHVAYIPAWQQRLGQKLNPIAELGSGAAALVISEDGKMYDLFTDILWQCGDSFWDAMENTVVFGRRSKTLVGTIESHHQMQQLM